MSDQPGGEKQVWNPKKVLGDAAIYWVVVLLLGFVAGGGEVVAVGAGRNLFGDPGVGTWLGWGVSFIVTFVVCCLVARLLPKAPISLICGSAFGYSLSTLAVATKPLLGETGGKIVFCIIFILGAALGTRLFMLIGKRHKEESVA